MNRPTPALLASLLLLATAATATAQRMPVPGDPDRLFVLLDLRPFLAANERPGPDLVLKLQGDAPPVVPVQLDQPLPPGPVEEFGAAPGGAAPPGAGAAPAPVAPELPADASFRQPLEKLAAFLRDFCDPPLRDGDDIVPVGPHHLAVLGSAAQLGFVERLLADAQQTRDLLTFEIQFFKVPPKTYAEHVEPFFGAIPAEQGGRPKRLAPREEVEALLETLHGLDDCDSLAAPRVSTRAMQGADLSYAKHISYLRDFEIERQGDARIANPVIGTIEDGLRVELRGTPLGDATAVRCSVLVQEVEQPIAEFKADLGTGEPVTIQLPSTRQIRFEHRALLPRDQSVVVAARCADGPWLVAVVGVVRSAAGK